MYNAKSRISSVGRVLDCRTGGRGFDSRGVRPILRVLKSLRNEGTAFALQAARPSHGWDDYVK